MVGRRRMISMVTLDSPFRKGVTELQQVETRAMSYGRGRGYPSGLLDG